MGESHHDLSPSNWVKRWECPGSRRSESGLPDVAGEDAKFGTLCHEVLAGKEDTDKDEIKELVAWVEEEGNKVEPNAFNWRVEEEHFLVWQRRLVTRGRVDRWCITTEEDGSLTGHVDDAKFGWDLPAPEIPMKQIAGYGCMILQAVPTLARVKCRALFARHKQIYECVVTRADLPGIVEWVTKLDEATRADDAPLVPGPQCRYCRAIGRCSATTELALAPRPDMLQLSDPEVLAKSLHATVVLKDWCEQVRQYGREHFTPELERLGWKVSSRIGARYVPDSIALYRCLSSVLDVEQMLKCMKVGVSDLEDIWLKAYVEKHGGSKENAKAALDAMAGTTIKRKSNTLVLTHSKAR